MKMETERDRNVGIERDRKVLSTSIHHFASLIFYLFLYLKLHIKRLEGIERYINKVIGRDKQYVSPLSIHFASPNYYTF